MLSAALLGCFVSIAPVLQPIPSSLHPEAQSETNETLVLESSGLAATESEALQQALLSAVSSAVGTLIDAETIVENDKVIKDRILSASNGFVEKYEKLESHKTTDGWSVKIRATVRSGTLRERLDQSIHRATSPVDGQNLGQRIKTKKQVAQDQGQLIRLAIGDCHKGVLKIERIGDPEAVEAPGLPEDMVRLRIAVRISVDDKAWRVRMEKARQTLAVLAIAKASTEISLRQCQPPQELHDRHGSLRIEKERPGNVDGMVLDAPALASIDMNEVPMRRGRFLPESWHAAVESGFGDTPFASKLRDSVLLRPLIAESRARNQALAVACIIDRSPASASATVHSFVVPEAVLEGCFHGYAGQLALSASALDKAGSKAAGNAVGLRVLGAWELNPEMGFAGGVAISGAMRQAFLLGGQGRLDLASNPELGQGLSITQGSREQKPAILVIAPGAAYLNPCGPGCYAGMAITSSWTGSMYLDLSEKALDSMETLQLEIEPK